MPDPWEIRRGVELGASDWQRQPEANKAADAFVARLRSTVPYSAALAPA